MTLRRILFFSASLVTVACGSSQSGAPGYGSGGSFDSGGYSPPTGGAGGIASGSGGTTQGGGASSGGAPITGGSGGGTGGGLTNGPDGSVANADAGDASFDPPDASVENTADSGSVKDGGTADADAVGKGDWRAGDYPPDINSQNYLEISGVKGQGTYVRQYKVHVPPSYDPRVPAPLVFCIHGLAQNAVMFCVTGAGLNVKSDQAGFIMVMPNGYQNSWNAGTCCGGASNEKLDDVALFRAIFAEVDKHLNVDHRRVYATGLSNGGYMSYRLACDAADLFTAVAPNAAAIGINSIGGGTNPTSDFTACTPSEPVSIFDTHGTADPLISYSLQAPSLALAVKNDGCSTTSVTPTVPASGGDTTCVTYPTCTAGTEVTACSVAGGGHCWFGSPDCGTGGGAIGALVVGANSNFLVNNDVIWDFFQRHAR
jgi:polyhydroxybutyrate depolymerase